jgi:hypothetical protein
VEQIPHVGGHDFILPARLGFEYVGHKISERATGISLQAGRRCIYHRPEEAVGGCMGKCGWFCVVLARGGRCIFLQGFRRFDFNPRKLRLYPP